MYPLFYIWYKGNNIKQHMEFKSLVHDFTPEEFADFYKKREGMATSRVTDLSEKSIDYMLERIDANAENLVDVGSGNGYFLKKVEQKYPQIKLHACDLGKKPKLVDCDFKMGDVENLPYEDQSIDVVTCHHTLEHVLDLDQSVRELKRVAKKQVVVVVPCQRYFYYTLDEHVRFFHYKATLTAAMKMKNFVCQKVWGDWVFIGDMEKERSQAK